MYGSTINRKRYYSPDYGWRTLEHGHVITLTHFKGDTGMFVCECGEDYVGPDRVLRARITAHRMEAFTSVRERL